MKFNFELVTPEKLVFSDEVEMVVAPGAEGDFGVLKGHCPMISSLRCGQVLVEGDQEQKKFYIDGGFADVTGDCLTILASSVQDTPFEQ